MSDHTPYVEDIIIIRRRIRIQDGQPMEAFQLVTTTKDEDCVLGMLAKGNFYTLAGEYEYLDRITVQEQLPAFEEEEGDDAEAES